MRALVNRTRAVADQVRALPPVAVEDGKRLEERFKIRMQSVINQLQVVAPNARLDPELYNAYDAMSEAMSRFG